VDLAAQVGIGEVVAQEDRFHGADEFFQRLIPQHSALLVARSLAPRARHHPVDRDLFARVVVLGPSVAVGVATQQFQRVYHRPVGRVVAPEIERGQQLGQHSPVVTGVGTGRHRADSASEGTSVGFLSPHGQGRATSTRRPPGTAPPTRCHPGDPAPPRRARTARRPCFGRGADHRAVRVRPGVRHGAFILWIRPISRSTSASVISLCRVQHSAASKVRRTVRGASSRSEG